MSLQRFASTYGNPQTGVRFRRAKVITSPASSKVTISMDDDTGAVTHTNVNFFGAMPPRAGQSVWAVVVAGEVFCLGAAAGEGGELPAVEVTRSSAQTITTGVVTDMSFNTLVGSDPWGMWNGAIEVVAPMTGFYMASASVPWNNVATGTYRAARLVVGGSQKYVNQIVHPTDTVGSSQNTVLNVAGAFRATANQIIKVQVIHDRGSDLDVLANNGGPRFAVAYLGGFP